MVHVTWGIIIACGKGEQIAPEVDTPFLNLGSKPVLTYSLGIYEQCQDVSGVVVVVNRDRIESVLGMAQMFGFSKVQKIVAGGSSRQTSVANGLKALEEEVSIVSVHDASRPCISVELLSETIKAAKRYGSGVAATEVDDSVKEVEKGLSVKRTVAGGVLWLAQSPQTFRRDLIQKGYETASKKKVAVEDDSAAVELIGGEVRLVPAGLVNIKVKTANDFNLAMSLMKL
jgi:2-C-methyl-D-erythritol 4-phosphate cytidylyltransferase